MCICICYVGMHSLVRPTSRRTPLSTYLFMKDFDPRRLMIFVLRIKMPKISHNFLVFFDKHKGSFRITTRYHRSSQLWIMIFIIFGQFYWYFFYKFLQLFPILVFVNWKKNCFLLPWFIQNIPSMLMKWKKSTSTVWVNYRQIGT